MTREHAHPSVATIARLRAANAKLKKRVAFLEQRLAARLARRAQRASRAVVTRRWGCPRL